MPHSGASRLQIGSLFVHQCWLPMILLGLQSALITGIAWRQSVTYDETGHLVAGLAHWKHGDFSLYAVNPPLSRLVAMLPTLPLSGSFEFPSYNSFPERREETRLGVLFSTQVDNYHRVSVVARLALLPFCWLGGLVCYAWARELYGFRAGLIALLLWCFSPNIQAVASQVLPDLAATSLFITTCFLLRKYLRREWPQSPVLVGFMLGAALLSKFTAVLLFPIVFLVFCWVEASSTEKTVAARLRGVLMSGFTIGCTSLLVINVGYFFEDAMLPLKEFEFLSESLSGIERSENIKGNRFISEWTAGLPVPLPRNYILGIDLAKFELERGYWSYLSGEFSSTGWWYFYLYGLAFKEPVGLFGLLLIAGAGLIYRAAWRKLLSDELLLVFTPVLLLALLSAETGYTHHLRYALPALPFVYILAARSVENAWLVKTQRACVGWFAVSSILCYPYQISYFNEIAGGPSNGWKHLNTSNYDWGQGLLYLREWVRKNPEKQPLYVMSSGAVPPSVYGIECKAVSPHVSSAGVSFPPGWYAISVGEMLKIKSSVLPFWNRTPVERVAHTVFIYHVENSFDPMEALHAE